MANFECNGISKLMKRIDDMGQAPDKVKKRLVNQGANLVLTQMKSDALSQFKGTGQGARSLAILEGRSGDSYLFLDIYKYATDKAYKEEQDKLKMEKARAIKDLKQELKKEDEE